MSELFLQAEPTRKIVQILTEVSFLMEPSSMKSRGIVRGMQENVVLQLFLKDSWHSLTIILWRQKCSLFVVVFSNCLPEAILGYLGNALLLFFNRSFSLNTAPLTTPYTKAPMVRAQKDWKVRFLYQALILVLSSHNQPAWSTAAGSLGLWWPRCPWLALGRRKPLWDK